jgi:exosortase
MPWQLIVSGHAPERMADRQTRVTREGPMTQLPASIHRSRNQTTLGILAAVVLILVWSYWTTLGQMALRWSQDPMYSHGYLVPGFAVLLLWFRRQQLATSAWQPSWWGAAVLVGALLLRAYGSYWYYIWDDQVSVVPALAGVVLLVGGWTALRWAWPAVAFLLFMVPLPYRLAVALTGPLQQLATLGSTFLMQTLAMPAVAEGNVIHLNEVELNIIEACSGLRMLVIFFALATAVALVIQRSIWQKVFLVASAVPIALLVNVLRITVTGILHESVSSEAANAVFHDLAGWLMMPVALSLLWLELKVLRHLVIEPNAGGPSFPVPRIPAPPPGRHQRPPVRRRWQTASLGARRAV